MKKILVLGALFLLILSGCATSPVNLIDPPSPNRLETLKKALIEGVPSTSPLDQSDSLAAAYLQAMALEKAGQKASACDQFQELANNQRFMVKEAALIHVLSDCDLSERELKKIWKKTIIPDYLKEIYFETSRKLAAEKKLSEFEAQFSFSLLPYRPIHSEKIKLINRAIALAQESNDKEKLKEYQAKLLEISPLNNPNITNQTIYSIAKDFEASRKFDKAQELYLQMINGDFSLEEKVRAYNAYRMSFKVERQLKKFLEKTYKMEAFLKNEFQKNPDDQKTQEAWVDAKLALARAVWTEHQALDAQKILDNLLSTKLGNNNQKANIRFVYGSLLLESKKNKDALSSFEDAIDYKITDNAILENVQWAVVWNNYLLKKNNRSIIANCNKIKFTILKICIGTC